MAANISDLVDIESIDGLYYKTTLNFTNGSHFEIGQAYAQQIMTIMPAYGATIDKFLFLSAESAPDHPGVTTLVSRAKDLIVAMPTIYIEELAGMATVFNSPIDKLGDGVLSANELLVFEVVHDVIDPGSCSAAAAFGQSTATGATIVGRNFDWYDMPGVSNLHNVQLYNNEDAADLVGIGLLGQLFPASLLSENHIAAALLDSDMKRGYFPTAGAASYPADLRYSLEQYASLQDIASFLLRRPSTHSYIAFLADRDTAAFLENDLEHPEARGLRLADSILRMGASWDVPDAVAAVNSFLLPGTTDDFTGDPSNTKRFASYKALFTEKLADGGTIGLQEMQAIVSYAGTDGIAKNSGAIYRATNDYPTYQSYSIDMGSLEMVASFGPTPGNPPHPSYVQVFATSPFSG